MSKNDSKILDMKKLIDEKRSKLAEVNKYQKLTNQVFNYDGFQFNINTLSKERVVECMVKINMMLLSAKDLGLEENYIVCGYTLNDWLSDLRGRLDTLSLKDQKDELARMESQLDKMLSDDKKTELVLEGMMKKLK